MFDLNYNLSFDDYITFNEYHLLNSESGKKQLRMFRMIIPLFCLAIIGMFAIIKEDVVFILILSVLFAILSAFWVAFSKKMLMKSIRKNIFKLNREGKLPFNRQGRLIFGEDSVTDISADTEIKFKYSVIEKFFINDSFAYIYFSAVQAVIVPFSCFSNETDKQEFIEFINQKLKNK